MNTLTLRPWHISDLDALCTLADNAKIARYMPDRFPHPYNQETGKDFIAITTAPENSNRFRVIEVDGEFAGGIGLHPEADLFRLNSEIGYWLGEAFWGKGIATQAVKLMVAHSFITFKFTRIYARVFGSNKASARVLEKAGFKLESTIPDSIIKNGELEDCLVFGIRT